MTPTELHEALDTKGLLDDAQNPGTYALAVKTPTDVESVARAFLDVSDVTPDDATLDRLTSGKCAYVGASQDVYSRLMDHARGEVRQATFLRAFEVTDVVGVWPEARPFQAEYNRAAELSRAGWQVWTDGGLV